MLDDSTAEFCRRAECCMLAQGEGNRTSKNVSIPEEAGSKPAPQNTRAHTHTRACAHTQTFRLAKKPREECSERGRDAIASGRGKYIPCARKRGVQPCSRAHLRVPPSVTLLVRTLT